MHGRGRQVSLKVSWPAGIFPAQPSPKDVALEECRFSSVTNLPSVCASLMPAPANPTAPATMTLQNSRFLCVCVCVCVCVCAQLHPTLCSPMDCTRFLCPWNFLGKNTGVGCHALFQEIFPTQGLNPHLLSPATAGGFFTTSAT